jgi:hypothetical protein
MLQGYNGAIQHRCNPYPGDYLMTSLESPTVASGISDAIRAKLHQAPAPLKLADVVKGLPRPKGMKAAEFQDDVRKSLEEDVRLGRVFCYPSGKNATPRYWSRDEKQVLRDKAVEMASVPRPLSALKTALGKEVKGTDGAFVEALVRELIGDERLFVHPPKTKKGAPLFGAAPPPPPLPPLAQAKHKKVVDKLVSQCRKLLTASGVAAEELLVALRAGLCAAGAPEAPSPPRESPATRGAEAELVADPVAAEGAEIDALILKAVSAAPVLSLADLRREMPAEFRGRAFDQAVLRLHDTERVILSQDADPARFSEGEQAQYVQDGGLLFTTIMKRS